MQYFKPVSTNASINMYLIYEVQNLSDALLYDPDNTSPEPSKVQTSSKEIKQEKEQDSLPKNPKLVLKLKVRSYDAYLCWSDLLV